MQSGSSGHPTKVEIGRRERRIEDSRLLRGEAEFLADISDDGVLHGVVVRSPHAHALIRSIDAAAAAKLPGVRLVLTGADLDTLPVKPISAFGPATLAGKPVAVDAPPYELLARSRVRHVGEPVAFVVAETEATALEAAECVAIDYEPLDAAIAPDDEHAMLGFETELGDPAAADAAFAKADRVVEIDVVNQRVAAVPLEPRGAQSEVDGKRVILRTGTQAPHLLRRVLAKDVFGWPEEKLRVIVPDTGGGFGAKAPVYREQGLVVWAAICTGRPVRWLSSRTEAFQSDTAGRDMRSRIALALRADGKILALRARIDANLGAYLSYFGGVPANIGLAGLVGAYAIACVDIRSRGYFTNTLPVDAYRGAGRPEAIYAIERAIDKAAHELGLAPDEMRKRNLVPREAIPYRTPVGTLYDSGDFVGSVERLTALADTRGFPARRAMARARGRLLGLGIAYYIERAAGGAEEAARIVLDHEGGADVMIGTMPAGQGHVTAYTQIVADRLGLDPARIRIHQGDTDIVTRGVGTFGSRSLPVGGSALRRAVERMIEILHPYASDHLEAATADVEFQNARFVVAGTDRSVDVANLAAALHRKVGIGGLPRLPGSLGVDLSAEGAFQPAEPTFPNGCHACEIEIDPETGEATLSRYCAVDDFGNEINPMLVDGQLHGGIAQGIGQALLEAVVHDPHGQILTGSLMDYAMPRAADMPDLVLARNPDPCRNNPLGLKGCAEAGAVCAPPAVINAVLDALAPLGVEAIDMPATPQAIWKAIQRARTETKVRERADV
ncbi:MAG: molybdopterin-dependent oxidoreductase [Alphaproteobacteria bacterium]|nr:molybdopterin-dependent oxidoreductase [Alphaproteobacteria bacterium]